VRLPTGIEGAHEKGGVEGEIGRFRRRHLVPVPKVASLAELNELIAAGDLADDDRVITGRPVTVAAAFAAEAAMLMPMPIEAFDSARMLEAQVHNRARVVAAELAVYGLADGDLSRQPVVWTQEDEAS
jgi:hypothetical protein